jgi:phosphoribosyl-ATP pyrophosphohydrolase
MDDLQAMVDTLDDRSIECFSKAVERIKKQIDEESMDFVFLLLDNPKVLRWFDERTNSLVHTFVKLTDIRNSLDEVRWQVSENEKESSVNPFDHPEEECLFVATPLDEGVTLSIQPPPWLPQVSKD